MNRVLCVAAGLSVAVPHVASAQLFPVQREPAAWLGLGVGAFNANDLHDGKTGTVWDFGRRTTPKYRASLEKAMRGNYSYGLDGSFVRAPILYTSTEVLGEAPSCPAGCAADVDVMSLYARFHAGGGPGLHQVVDAGVGVVSYQNFRRESDGARLEPQSERDLAFIFGYGFGYSLSPRTQVNLVQEYGFNFHESRNTPSGSSNTLRFSNTRLSLRVGLGDRQPVRRPPTRRR